MAGRAAADSVMAVAVTAAAVAVARVAAARVVEVLNGAGAKGQSAVFGGVPQRSARAGAVGFSLPAICGWCCSR